jgi:hypothetical protein
MTKRFSFAGVSAAAIALAVLCPSSARALSFNWTFTSGTGAVVSGTINNLIEGSNTYINNPSAYAVVTSASGGLGLGSSGIVGRNLMILADPNSEIFVSGGVPLSNGGKPYVGFRDIVGMKRYDTFFSNGSSGLFAMSAGYNDNGSFSNEISSTPQSFTAVPAPLPLLGLGAAAAYSRKLKQRIAMRRKREEVGAAL